METVCSLKDHLKMEAKTAGDMQDSYIDATGGFVTDEMCMALVKNELYPKNLVDKVKESSDPSAKVEVDFATNTARLTNAVAAKKDLDDEAMGLRVRAVFDAKSKRGGGGGGGGGGGEGGGDSKEGGSGGGDAEEGGGGEGGVRSSSSSSKVKTPVPTQASYPINLISTHLPHILQQEGFTPHNTCYGSCVCPEERTLLMERGHGFMPTERVFPLGSLGGLPASRARVRAFLNLAPQEGDGCLFVVCASHVGITEKGDLGVADRGKDRSGSVVLTPCCSAARNALERLLEDDAYEHEESDYEQFQLHQTVKGGLQCAGGGVREGGESYEIQASVRSCEWRRRR